MSYSFSLYLILFPVLPVLFTVHTWSNSKCFPKHCSLGGRVIITDHHVYLLMTFCRLENDSRNTRHMGFIKITSTPPLWSGADESSDLREVDNTRKGNMARGGVWPASGRPHPQKTSYHASGITGSRPWSLDWRSGNQPCPSQLNPKAFCDTPLPTDHCSGPRAF